MASPQLENGYTKIANEILDAVIKCPEIVRGALFPVICVVWRKTYGWNKKEDAISISQFVEMTGYSKRTIIYAIQELEAKNVLKIKRECKGLLKETNIISFNKNYKEWVVQNSAPQVTSNRGSAKLRKKVVQNSAQNVRGFAHTKETITKEIQKKAVATATEGLLLGKNKKDMGWNNKSDDYLEDDLQIDPDYVPVGKKEKNSASADARAVFALFDNPAKGTWHLRAIERSAAQILYDTYGIETLTKRLKRIAIEREKKDPYFPDAQTPSQLLDKMPKIERYLGI